MSVRAVVFVYGTLRAGESNHALLAGSPRLDDDHTAPRYTLLDLGAYPGLVEGGDTAVVGETYVVDAPTRARLDALEDHPRLYRRTEFTLASGRVAELYVLDPRFAIGGAPIESGDWCAHRRARR
jgi:gamma-glutamylcyclotransferase (GGCT)/AIG2-like uncharacterized protein YtfP